MSGPYNQSSGGYHGVFVAWLKRGKWNLPLQMAGKIKRRMCCVQNFQSHLTDRAVTVISVDATGCDKLEFPVLHSSKEERNQ